MDMKGRGGREAGGSSFISTRGMINPFDIGQEYWMILVEVSGFGLRNDLGLDIEHLVSAYMLFYLCLYLFWWKIMFFLP